MLFIFSATSSIQARLQYRRPLNSVYTLPFNTQIDFINFSVYRSPVSEKSFSRENYLNSHVLNTFS